MIRGKVHFYNDATLVGYCGSKSNQRSRFIGATTCRRCLSLMSKLVAGQLEATAPTEPVEVS